MNSLIRKCIDKIKGDIDGVCDSATPGASNCLSCFQKQYFNDNLISYDCDNKVCIYVARFFPVHVRENTEAFNLLPHDYKKKLTRQNPINIMSIGGGPGSDSFAVKNFLINSERRGDVRSEKDIYLLRVDKEKNWDSTAGEINSKITHTEYLKFNARKQLFDITEKDDWPERNNRLFHIFTMSYFLSELTSDEQVKVVAEYINMHSSRNCSFLFVNDRNDYKVDCFKQVLFQNLHCNTNYETEDSDKYWCGFSYNDDDRDFIGPKLNTNSIRFFKALYI